MRRRATSRVLGRPQPAASADDIYFRPGVAWRWMAGAAGLLVCVVAVRYLAQHPTLGSLVVGVPVVTLGCVMMARAPRVLVRLTSTEAHVSGLFGSRRLPRERILGVRSSGAAARIVWKTRRGTTRATRLPGLSALGGGRTSRAKRFLHEMDRWLAR